MTKETVVLGAMPRIKSEDPNALRKTGHVPGIIYGAVKENAMVKCSLKELHNVYVKAGENTLVEVTLDGKKIPCLIHAVSLDPITDKEDHVDLYAVDMTKKVTTHVPIIVTGESAAIKTLGGVLVTVHDNVEVTCLPKDLPSGFTVDISVLENFRETITVSSLKVPAGVTVKSAPEMVLITVQEPRKEEVVEVAAAPVEGAAGAAAPAAGAEGAAAPAAGAAAKTDDKAAAGKDSKKK